MILFAVVEVITVYRRRDSEVVYAREIPRHIRCMYADVHFLICGEVVRNGALFKHYHGLGFVVREWSRALVCCRRRDEKGQLGRIRRRR